MMPEVPTQETSGPMLGGLKETPDLSSFTGKSKTFSEQLIDELKSLHIDSPPYFTIGRPSTALLTFLSSQYLVNTKQ